MVATFKADRDPEYAKIVQKVLEFSREGLTSPEIADKLEDQAHGITSAAVAKIVQRSNETPSAVAHDADIERRATEDKVLVMMAAKFRQHEIAKAMNLSPTQVKNIAARRDTDLDEVKDNWKTWSVEDGYAAREFRIRQLHEELVYFDVWIPEIEWIYVKEHKAQGRHMAEATGEMIQRKWQLDRYGRPIWTTLRLKLLDEMAKLQGDHVSTINVNKLDDPLVKQLDKLAEGHTQALAEPVTDAEFTATDAPA